MAPPIPTSNISLPSITWLGHTSFDAFASIVGLKDEVDTEETVRIIYDWRLARVIDNNNLILDELYWNRVSTKALVNRLSDLQSGRMSSEAYSLKERFPDAKVDALGVLSYLDWPELSDDEVSKFTEASTRLAKRGVADSSGDIDRRLDMLVSANNELRASWTTLEARSIEWVGLFLSELNLDSERREIPAIVSSSLTINEVAEKFGVAETHHQPSEDEWSVLKSHAQSVVDLTERLSNHEDAIRVLANNYVPSLSALIGPIGAAKLLVLAGGRERLARMPSGSLQVLGANAAMAAHRRGAPPPKHGAILFSMPAVSRSPRWVRGKIARYLAGKASIAVRVDHFNGTPWTKEDISKIHKEAEAIKNKFPKPPKRR